MRIISFGDTTDNIYIIGTNTELSKVLDICNYHTEIYPETSKHEEKNDFLKNAVLYGLKDDDEVYVVYIQNYIALYTDVVYSYYIYDVNKASWFFSDDIDGISECKTPDEVYYSVANTFCDNVVECKDFTIADTVDFLISNCGGRVVAKEEYINFDNLSEDERVAELIYDLNQIDFFQKGSPEEHVLININKEEVLETYPELKGYGFDPKLKIYRFTGRPIGKRFKAPN